MSVLAPFQPKYLSNQVVTAAAASAAVGIDGHNKQVRILNSGAGKAYVRTYNSSTGAFAATVNDYPILPNASATLTKGPGHDMIAYMSVAGTTLEVMTGEGW